MVKKSGAEAISHKGRVHIEYHLEKGESKKKIELPFVMGVLAGLSGNPEEPLAPVAERKFQEINVENFDAALKSMKPRVTMQVPNTLTGEGNLNLALTFESMDDFKPAAIARKTGALNQLLEARTQLENLTKNLDGRVDAEEMILKMLNDPALLQSLASAPKPKDETPQS